MKEITPPPVDPIKDYLSKMGKKSAKSRFKGLTKKQISEKMKALVNKRKKS